MADVEVILKSELHEQPEFNCSENEVGSPVEKCPYAEDEDASQLISSHFTDVDGKKIVRVTDQTEVDFVIKSKNVEGKRVVVDFGELSGQIAYNEDVIDDLRCLLVKISKSTEKIRLKVKPIRLPIAPIPPPSSSLGGVIKTLTSAKFEGVGFFRPTSTYRGEFGFDWMRYRILKDAINTKDILGYYSKKGDPNDPRIAIGAQSDLDDAWKTLKAEYGKIIAKELPTGVDEYSVPHMTIWPGQSVEIDTLITVKKGSPERLWVESSTKSLKIAEPEISDIAIGDLKKRGVIKIEASKKKFSGTQTIKLFAEHGVYDKDLIGQIYVHGNNKIKKKKFNVILVQVNDGDFDDMKTKITKKIVDVWCNEEGYNQIYMDINLEFYNLDLKEDKTFQDTYVKELYTGTKTTNTQVHQGTRYTLFNNVSRTNTKKFIYEDAVPLRSYAINKLKKRRKSDMDFVIYNLECKKVEETIIQDASGNIEIVPIESSFRLNGKAEGIGGGDKVIAFKTGQKKSTFVHEGLHNLGLYHTFSQPHSSRANNKYQYEKYKTDNIMDYVSGTDLRKSLFKWQWKVLNAI